MEGIALVVASKLMSIGIIIVSVIAGLIFLYVLSDSPKMERKKRVEEIGSQIFNFIIFVWVGKIILNFSTLIKDPMVILAYPSNAEAFYLAVLFSAGLLVYKSKRQQLDVQSFLVSFLPVFLGASFLYEFIQLVWNNSTYSFGYIVLLTVLVVLFLLIRERVTVSMLFTVILIGWSGGILLLAFTQPFVTVFGYIIAPWFVVLFFIMRDAGMGPLSRASRDDGPVPMSQKEVVINEEGNSGCVGCRNVWVGYL